MRCKTNAKNKTWADSEPVLLRYLRGLRRRLQLDTSEEQQEGLLEVEGVESEPEGVDPGREPTESDEAILDSSDDEDPGDVLVALTTALLMGYEASVLPEAAQLEYKSILGQELVGRLILSNW